jgi:putative flippase GtrA
MRAQLYQVLRMLAGLPGLRLVPWGNREWQKSSTQSGVFWIMGTLIIFKVARYLGHGLASSVGVSLAMDLAAFSINKLWIWNKRSTTVTRSLGRNMIVSGTTFGVNLLIVWQAVDHLGVHYGRYAAGCYGILINPVMFHVRDRVVFAEYDFGEFREIAAIRCKMEMDRAVALSRQLLMKTGGM